MNEVTLRGHVGQTPVITTLSNGLKVMKLSLATTASYKDANGIWQNHPTQWHNVVAWRKLAELPIKKGDLLLVRGEIQYRSYQKDDETRYITEILAKTNGIDIIHYVKSDKPQLDDQGFTIPKDPINARTNVDSSFLESDIKPAPINPALPF